MNQNTLNWLYVCTVIVVPFVLVHMFAGSAVARLFSIVWVGTLFPVAIIFLIFFTKQTIHFKNYSNPNLEKNLLIVVKISTFLIAVACFFFFTIPVISSVYKVYFMNEGLTVIEDSVEGLSATALIPGIYFGLSLTTRPDVHYMYFFPTVFQFDDIRYKFTILPGTTIILNAEPE